MFEAARQRRPFALLPKATTAVVTYDGVPRPPRPLRGPALRTVLDAEALHRRLLAIHRDSRSAEEEQGINILYLAYGFLRWFENGSEVAREAPLILIPVSLSRDKARATFELKPRDEEIGTNQPLAERLRGDFGLSLPEIPPEHAGAEEWRAADYFAAVREAVSPQLRWSVDGDGLELGFYSFSKLLMIRDLEPPHWPGNAILSHALLRAFAADGFGAAAPAYDESTRLDDAFAPGGLVQVLDADASQTLVIESVRAGSNLVVQGPPGTGKSQTIANIIAAAVHDGKSVLVAAEKMVALEVVEDRLERAGLGQLCLQLHSRAANRRLVVAELDRTLRLAAELEVVDPSARLAAVRDRLNAAAAALHRPIADTGCTPFAALGRLVAAKGPPPAQAFVDEALVRSGAAQAEAETAAERLAALLRSAGPPAAHPWWGVGELTLQPADVERAVEPLERAAAAADALGAVLPCLARDLGLSAESNLREAARLGSILKQLVALDARAAGCAAVLAAAGPAMSAPLLRATAAGRRLAALTAASPFTAAAAVLPAHTLRGAVAAGVGSLLARWGGAYRHACRALAGVLAGPLPPAPGERLALIDRLLALQQAQSDFASAERPIASLLGGLWGGAASDFAALEAVDVLLRAAGETRPALPVDRLLAFHASGQAGERLAALRRAAAEARAGMTEVLRILGIDAGALFGSDVPAGIALAEFAARCHGWVAARGRYDEWVRLVAAQRRLAPLAPAIAAAAACGALAPDALVPSLRLAFYEAVWKRAAAAEPELSRLDGAERDRAVAEFRSLEAAQRLAHRSAVRRRHLAAMPTGTLGPMGVIRGEIARKARHMPIRRLMREAGPTLQRIKPVFLMSPISVAQYLPPGVVSFDLLVIDEASQIRPEDALGLVARARQIVVVGDSKQLPPTTFFDRLTADEAMDEEGEDAAVPAPPPGAGVAGSESILSLAEARGLPSRMLRWHYRSRHPSLIAVSNAEFYRRLVMPPAPQVERGRLGLVLRRVAGAYDRGGRRDNPIEAEAVAAEVARHAREEAGRSLGVATFSNAQRDAVTEALERLRREDGALDAFLGSGDGGPDEVFVKSLENVQGDERDVILISVGYGPRIAGSRLDSMGFGPVSTEGGERRLNVLFTRARERCELFCSFPAGDIDLARAKGEGARVLKRFLDYAETGRIDAPGSVGEPDSPFEEDVAAAIRDLGYAVEAQVGDGGFRIDLAVRHPGLSGRYMLAVECDGATYHSSPWARERDRLRQEALEGMGWRFHRIWSTDWFYRRAAQVERLHLALVQAENDAWPMPAHGGVPRSEAVAPLISPASPAPPVAPRRAEPYRLARLDMATDAEPRELPLVEAARIVAAIVGQEGPIHRDEVARRFAALLGKERAGSRIGAAVDAALDRLAAEGAILVEGAFSMTPAQRDDPPVRDRARMPASLQKLIAPRELRAAMAMAERASGPLPPDAMAMAVARLFGLGRAGGELRAAVTEASRQAEAERKGMRTAEGPGVADNAHREAAPQG